MAFLILTERGLADLRNAAGRLPSPVWVNPGLLSDAEIGSLRGAGTDIVVLSHRIDPASLPQIGQAAAEIARRHGGTIWVECGPSAPAPGADAPDGAGARSVLRALRGHAGALSGRAVRRMKRFAASDGPVLIVPYMGFGTPQRLMVQGRVIKDEGFAEPDLHGSAWDNFIELYKRIGSDEVPGARLRARVGTVEREVVANAGGYFEAEIALPVPLDSAGWHTVELELVDPAPPPGKAIRAVAQSLVPPSGARFGIISDIDDTVLWSNVTNKLRMLKMLAVTNAHTRKPFKGVAALYRALRDGAGGDEGNPVFYVSSSPWHLYTPLVDFFAAQEIPLGPLLLRELGLRALFSGGRHHDHKLKNIERILQTYPQLPFVLIGDSGQMDPEIYKEVVERHPGRVRAIYIRSINPDPARIDALDRLIAEVRRTDAQLVLVPDSEFAAAHAAAEGLISASGMAPVREDKRDDEQAPAP